MAGLASPTFAAAYYQPSTQAADEEAFSTIYARKLTPRNSSHYRFHNYSGKMMREQAKHDLLYPTTTATTQAGAQREPSNTTTTIASTTTTTTPTPTPVPRPSRSPLSSPMGASPAYSSLSSDSGSSNITQNFAAKYKPRSMYGSEKYLSAQSLREKRMQEDELMMRAKNYARMEFDRSSIAHVGGASKAAAASHDSYYTGLDDELWACPCGGECAGCKVW